MLTSSLALVWVAGLYQIVSNSLSIYELQHILKLSLRAATGSALCVMALQIKTVHWWPYVNHASRDPMRPTHMKTRKDWLGLLAYG